MMDLLLRGAEGRKALRRRRLADARAPGVVLSGLILRQIFDHNQEEFTRPSHDDSDHRRRRGGAVRAERAGAAAEPYIAWVKEGRKYDLGAVLITQQPGSIPD